MANLNYILDDNDNLIQCKDPFELWKWYQTHPGVTNVAMEFVKNYTVSCGFTGSGDASQKFLLVVIDAENRIIYTTYLSSRQTAKDLFNTIIHRIENTEYGNVDFRFEGYPEGRNYK